jgi:hypothetical protein
MHIINILAVMRLGKRKEKEKDPSEVKSQGVDGITRLICLSKGQNPLKGKYRSNVKIVTKFKTRLTLNIT